MAESLDCEVLIVGGGPAGLSAALVLGRCRRRVLLCDTGKPRNISSRAMHGFLTRDGISPRRFLELAHRELGAYPCVRRVSVEVTSIRRSKGGFAAVLGNGRRLRASRVLLATGLVDAIPDLPGVSKFYGRGAFHCPYCDGWELRDQPLVVYGKGRRGYKFAKTLLQWSSQVTLCTNGPLQLGAEQVRDLDRLGVRVERSKIVRLAGRGRLESVLLQNGRKLPCRGFFFNTPSYPKSPLANKLGCEFNAKGGICTRGYGATAIPGLYAAGNILRDVQLVIVAAAEGARAAFDINCDLQAMQQNEVRHVKSRPRTRRISRN